MANFFGTYAFDIWTVAEKRNVDVGVGFDMLRADIANGRSQNCSDALPGSEHGKIDIALDLVPVDCALMLRNINTSQIAHTVTLRTSASTASRPSAKAAQASR